MRNGIILAVVLAAGAAALFWYFGQPAEEATQVALSAPPSTPSSTPAAEARGVQSPSATSAPTEAVPAPGGDPKPVRPAAPPAPQASPPTGGPGSSPSSSPSPSPVASLATGPQDSAPAAASEIPQSAEPAAGGQRPPSFDVVRISPQGNAVIAGRAAPGAEVTVRDRGETVGTVTADERGEWVLLPKKPFAPGARELGLSARRGEAGKPVQSDAVVVLSVPERPGTPRAAPSSVTPAGEGDEPVGTLAVVMPRTGKGPVKVLQGRAPGEEPLLGSVDYDEEGAPVFAGRTAPGAEVQVFVNEKPVGSATADAEGSWRLSPAEKVAPGLHRLRVDQVEPGGRVAARVETPFALSPIRAAALDDAVVIVQPGNSLWRIARRAYGGGTQYTLIFEANRDQIANPDLIYPGQIFDLPRATN